MINFEEFKTKSGKTRMSEQEKFEFIEYINKNGTEEEKAALAFNWVDVWARDEQVPYAFCDVSSWDTWTFISGRGAGKLIDNNTPILTPYRGWIKHGDLLPGDYVFNEHGKPTKVLQIHPQKATNKLEYYRVLFNDGTHIDACGDHLWHTWTHQERKQYMRRDGARGLLPAPQDYPFDWGTYDDKVTVRTKTRTTKQILETLKIGKRGDNNHSIPLGKACVFPDRQLPIHPYLLGYWLGNGSHDSHTLTIHNDDVLDIKHKLDSIGITYKEYSNPKGTYCTTLATYILEELKNLNLFRNKHIPDMYLTSSIEQRWELIRGLLDSDGCFEGGNRIVFYNTNLNIISGAKKILGSLGCKFFETNKIGKIKGVEYKMCYSLDIKSLDVNPFNITRKSDKWVKWRNSKKSQFFRQRSRIITDIVPITPVDMMCITVDSPSALYLVGDQCVPTHNTKAGAELVRELVFNIFPNFPIRIGCITPSFSQIEAVVALGDSGVMNCLAPWQREKARFYSTSRKIVFNEGEANESQVRFYSADDPEALRGSQWHFCWLRLPPLI
jgi:hypothetical protein